MDRHLHVNETGTSAGCHRETTTGARDGSRSNDFAGGSNVVHAPAAVKRCEPTRSNPVHCDPCHREKGYLSLFQMARAQNELRVRACHGRNGEAKRWVNQHEMEERTLILFSMEVASSCLW